MSRRQNVLSFVCKGGKFCKVQGKGLITHANSIGDRFKRMTLQGCGVARKHIVEGEGGVIKHHNRPYQLKDSQEPKPKSNNKYTPIHFKI